MRRLTEFALNFKYAFRPHKPRLIVRLTKAVIRSNLFDHPPLRYVDFAIDFACNLKCEHCFATVLKNDARRRMDVADYAWVARQCMDLGTVNFSFQGGEPTMFKKLPDIISACQPHKNVISVTTNGTLLSIEKVRQLRAVGVDILTVSLDSFVAAEHDAFRGMKGSFERTMEGIRLARANGLNVTLGTVVTHQSLHSQGINGIIEFAVAQGLILNLILPVRAGRWVENTESIMTQEDLEYIDGLTKMSLYIRTDFQANLGRYGCGAVKEILYLTPYGDVLACPFLHISLGNVFEEPIATIRSRALQNPYFAVYHQKCLASTDEEFINRYLSKTFGAESLPLPWNCVFSSEEPEVRK